MSTFTRMQTRTEAPAGLRGPQYPLLDAEVLKNGRALRHQTYPPNLWAAELTATSLTDPELILQEEAMLGA